MNKLKQILFWLISLTWGSLMTIPGLLIVASILVFDKNAKAHKNGWSFIVEVGGNWGGLELGACAICGHYSESNKYWFEHTRCHEFGHCLQNCIFGPLMPFLVSIPSAVRYWYQRIARKHGKVFASDWYDSIWFEGTATKYGKKFIAEIEQAHIYF